LQVIFKQGEYYMLKRWLSVLMCVIAVMSFSACGSNNEETESSVNTPEESKIKVSVTFDAMKEFVSAIGKDKVEIWKDGLKMQFLPQIILL